MNVRYYNVEKDRYVAIPDDDSNYGLWWFKKGAKTELVRLAVLKRDNSGRGFRPTEVTPFNGEPALCEGFKYPSDLHNCVVMVHGDTRKLRAQP